MDVALAERLKREEAEVAQLQSQLGEAAFFGQSLLDKNEDLNRTIDQLRSQNTGLKSAATDRAAEKLHALWDAKQGRAGRRSTFFHDEASASVQKRRSTLGVRAAEWDEELNEVLEDNKALRRKVAHLEHDEQQALQRESEEREKERREFRRWEDKERSRIAERERLVNERKEDLEGAKSEAEDRYTRMREKEAAMEAQWRKAEKSLRSLGGEAAQLRHMEALLSSEVAHWREECQEQSRIRQELLNLVPATSGESMGDLMMDPGSAAIAFNEGLGVGSDALAMELGTTGGVGVVELGQATWVKELQAQLDGLRDQLAAAKSVHVQGERAQREEQKSMRDEITSLRLEAEYLKDCIGILEDCQERGQGGTEAGELGHMQAELQEQYKRCQREELEAQELRRRNEAVQGLASHEEEEMQRLARSLLELRCSSAEELRREQGVHAEAMEKAGALREEALRGRRRLQAETEHLRESLRFNEARGRQQQQALSSRLQVETRELRRELASSEIDRRGMQQALIAGREQMLQQSAAAQVSRLLQEAAEKGLQQEQQQHHALRQELLQVREQEEWSAGSAEASIQQRAQGLKDELAESLQERQELQQALQRQLAALRDKEAGEAAWQEELHDLEGTFSQELARHKEEAQALQDEHASLTSQAAQAAGDERSRLAGEIASLQQEMQALLEHDKGEDVSKEELQRSHRQLRALQDELISARQGEQEARARQTSEAAHLRSSQEDFTKACQAKEASCREELEQLRMAQEELGRARRQEDRVLQDEVAQLRLLQEQLDSVSEGQEDAERRGLLEAEAKAKASQKALRRYEEELQTLREEASRRASESEAELGQWRLSEARFAQTGQELEACRTELASLQSEVLRAEAERTSALQQAAASADFGADEQERRAAQFGSELQLCREEIAELQDEVQRRVAAAEALGSEALGSEAEAAATERRRLVSLEATTKSLRAELRSAEEVAAESDAGRRSSEDEEQSLRRKLASISQESSSGIEAAEQLQRQMSALEVEEEGARRAAQEELAVAVKLRDESEELAASKAEVVRSLQQELRAREAAEQQLRSAHELQIQASLAQAAADAGRERLGEEELSRRVAALGQENGVLRRQVKSAEEAEQRARLQQQEEHRSAVREKRTAAAAAMDRDSEKQAVEELSNTVIDLKREMVHVRKSLIREEQVARQHLESEEQSSALQEEDLQLLIAKVSELGQEAQRSVGNQKVQAVAMKKLQHERDHLLDQTVRASKANRCRDSEMLRTLRAMRCIDRDLYP